MSELVSKSSAVVIMRYVRTEFGRSLREKVNRQGEKWVACTGHGRDSCFRAIKKAVELFLGR